MEQSWNNLLWSNIVCIQRWHVIHMTHNCCAWLVPDTMIIRDHLLMLCHCHNKMLLHCFSCHVPSPTHTIFNIWCHIMAWECLVSTSVHNHLIALSLNLRVISHGVWNVVFCEKLLYSMSWKLYTHHMVALVCQTTQGHTRKYMYHCHLQTCGFKHSKSPFNWKHIKHIANMIGYTLVCKKWEEWQN